MRPTPLFTDTYELALDTCRQLDGDKQLASLTVDTSLSLLGAVHEALHRADLPLEEADAQLARLRLWLRLRADLDRGDRAFALRALERCDEIGRQVGGLLRRTGRS